MTPIESPKWRRLSDSLDLKLFLVGTNPDSPPLAAIGMIFVRPVPKELMQGKRL